MNIQREATGEIYTPYSNQPMAWVSTSQIGYHPTMVTPGGNQMGIALPQFQLPLRGSMHHTPIHTCHMDGSKANH